MSEIAAAVARWTAAGHEVAIATVVDHAGSAPRPRGAKMAVCDDGRIAGAVSGGCVEGAVVAEAVEVLGGAPPRLCSFGIDGDELGRPGLPCGGEISVWIERRVAAVADAPGWRGAVVTRLDDGRKLHVAADGRAMGSLGSAALNAEAVSLTAELAGGEHGARRTVGGIDVFVDLRWPAPRLLVFGATDVAVALCRLAAATGWRVAVVDPRSAFARRERFPEAEDVIAAWPQEAAARLGGLDGATSVAVLTHDPKLDDAALTLALASDSAYIGAMGSRRVRAQRHRRLLAAGVAPQQLARLATPIGLDLGGVTPEETALSILAEVVACRRGGAGGRLRDKQGPIHDQAPARVTAAR